MSILKYKTRENTSPQGLPKVYFCSLESDFIFFDEISNDILEKQNCAVCYESETNVERDEVFYFDLSSVQLFVFPVTTLLLTTDNKVWKDFDFAISHKIPVLPIMLESGLEKLFNEKFGDIQFLNKYEKDETALSYEEKLLKYLSSVLVGDKRAKKIRDAFDAYIFLSYRKIDRIYAQKLMKLIHKNEFYRDIAIWYDEFLTPGENFNDSIKEAFEKSGLFVLTVTPNILKKVTDENGVERDNYVKAVEYEMFKKRNNSSDRKMPIIPAEMAETDKKELNSEYDGLPPCVNGEEELDHALTYALNQIAIKENDGSPEHNFFIGLAYLGGIDVEKDMDKALSLITYAAEKGLAEAVDQLITMYENGIGVTRDYNTAVFWHNNKIQLCKAEYESSPTNYNAVVYYYSILSLADAHLRIGKISHAEEKYKLSAQFLYSLENKDTLIMRSVSSTCNRLGNLYKNEGRLKEARLEYEKSLSILLEINLEKESEKDAFQYEFDRALAYSTLGECLTLLRDYDSAKKNIEECIKIKKSLWERSKLSKMRSSLAVSYTSLGRVYERIGDFKKSIELYSKSVQLLKESDSFSNISLKTDISIALEHLANLYMATGNMLEAKKDLEEVLSIRKQISESTETISSKRNLSRTYNILGNLHFNIGNLSEAKVCYENCLLIFEEIYKNCPSVEASRDLSGVLNNYALILETENNLSEAEKLLIKGMELRKKNAEDNNNFEFTKELAESYNNLGIFYLRIKNIEKSEKYHRLSIELREKIYSSSEEKSELALGYFNLAQMLQTANRSDSKDYFLKAIEISKEISEKNNSLIARKTYAGSLCGLGFVLRKENNFDEAREYLKLGSSIYEALGNDTGSLEHFRYAAFAYCNLGEIFKLKNDFKTATFYFKKACTIFESISKKHNNSASLIELALSFCNVFLVCDVEEKIFYLKKGLEVVEQLLSIDPDNQQALELKKLILEEMKKE